MENTTCGASTTNTTTATPAANPTEIHMGAMLSIIGPVMTAVNMYIDQRVNAAINAYSRQVSEAMGKLELNIDEHVRVSLASAGNSTQIMAVLNEELMTKMREIAKEEIDTHESDAHDELTTREDVRDIVDERVERAVNDYDFSPNIRDAVRDILHNDDYVTEERLTEAISSHEDDEHNDLVTGDKVDEIVNDKMDNAIEETLDEMLEGRVRRLLRDATIDIHI